MAVPSIIDIEHRWGRRFDVDIEVHVSVGLLKGIDGILRNVSSSGGLITTDYALRCNSLISVSVRSPFMAQAVVQAHITRVRPEAVGLEWCDFGCLAIRSLLHDALATSRRLQP